MTDEFDLGPCCACFRRGRTVRNILMLPFKAPVAGMGWGCIVCGLACDGALAVLCDYCFHTKRTPTHICVGYASSGKRATRPERPEPFDHDVTKHRDEIAAFEQRKDAP